MTVARPLAEPVRGWQLDQPSSQRGRAGRTARRTARWTARRTAGPGAALGRGPGSGWSVSFS